MSCKTFNLKSCEIRGATYQGRKIDFVNKVITQDNFTAKVYDTQGYLLTEIIGLKSGSVVYFPFTAIQNLSKDKYRIKYWADFYLLGTILLGEEELTIGNTCPNCEVDDSTLPFVLELGTETIDFTLQLVYIAIGDGGGEVDLSEYLKKVDADELYALKNHTHSYNDLTDLPPNQNIDSVVTIGAVTATTNNVNLALHFSGVNRVYIGGENYYKVTEDNFSFTPVTTGIKVLLIYALPDSQIFYLAEGVESTQAVEPTGLPTNALLVARLIASSTGIIVTVEDYNYKQKSDDTIQTEILDNDNPNWIFGARTNYDIVVAGSATTPTLAGFKYVDSSGGIWTGKKSIIRNRTGFPLLLKKVTPPADALVYFPFKQDYTIADGKDAQVIYDNNNEVALIEVGGGKTDTVARTINFTLEDLGVATESEITPQMVADYFNSLGLEKSENEFYILKQIVYNFDVTANWNLTTDVDGNNTPVTDSNSFKTWLESGWTPEQWDSPNSFQDVVVSDFNLVNGRLTANVITSGGEYFALEGLEITQVNSVSIGDFTTLGLSSNQLTSFNPTIALPTGLQNLGLSDNQIVDWSLSEPWANSLPTGTAYIYTQNNPTSSNGTTFKSILTGKGYNVQS